MALIQGEGQIKEHNDKELHGPLIVQYEQQKAEYEARLAEVEAQATAAQAQIAKSDPATYLLITRDGK